MNIFSTMDRIHHLRTWTVPQAMRKLGFLEEGYNPKRDRYEHKLFGITFKSMTFPAMTDLKQAGRTSVPLTGKSGAQYPFVPTISNKTYLKKKFEVVLPKGEVRRYTSMEHLAKDMSRLRHGPTRFGNPKSRKVYESLTSDRKEKWDQLVMKRTGLKLSQSGCDPASVITIRNLKTGACLMRQVTVFDLSVYGYNHSMPEVLALPKPEGVPIGVAVH